MNSREVKRQEGVTLVELVVVIMILAVIGGFALPSWAIWTDRIRLATYSQRTVDSLWLARSHAISSGVRITLCPAAASGLCDDAGRWGEGWVIFKDQNRNGQREPDEKIVWQEPALKQGWRLWGNAHVARYISYDPDGRSTLVNGAMQAGTMTLCKEPTTAGQPHVASRVVINMVGRPRIETGAKIECG
jgi:type IV fimbrial biogenesis protein FimT